MIRFPASPCGIYTEKLTLLPTLEMTFWQVDLVFPYPGTKVTQTKAVPCPDILCRGRHLPLAIYSRTAGGLRLVLRGTAARRGWVENGRGQGGPRPHTELGSTRVAPTRSCYLPRRLGAGRRLYPARKNPNPLGVRPRRSKAHHWHPKSSTQHSGKLSDPKDCKARTLQVPKLFPGPWVAVSQMDLVPPTNGHTQRAQI